MSRWMVNVRGQQFSATGLDELRKLARAGDLGPGDIVQPPGAAEWLYAVELPELKGAFPADMGFEGDGGSSAGLPPAVKAVVAVAMAVASVGMWSYALSLRDAIPEAADVDLLGKKGLSFTEVLVTADNAALHATAATSAEAVAPMKKNGKCELLAKRGRWYKLRCEQAEGYAEVDSVVPAYFFADEKVKEDHDPLYNPDRYVIVANSAWRESDDPVKRNTTVFNFLVQNNSKFAMADLRMQATIKDSGGKVLEQVEIPVVGEFPAQDGTMVGTLLPAKNDRVGKPEVMSAKEYEDRLKTDPKLGDRWLDGVEVTLSGGVGAEAAIDILEVRAIPKEG